MFLHSLFFWVSSRSLCVSCFHERSRHAPRSLTWSFGTLSWASSSAPSTRLPSVFHVGSDALCRAAPLPGPPPPPFHPVASLYHLVPGQGTVASLTGVSVYHAQPHLTAPGLPCSRKERKKKTELPDFLTWLCRLKSVWLVNVTFPVSQGPVPYMGIISAYLLEC